MELRRLGQGDNDLAALAIARLKTEGSAVSESLSADCARGHLGKPENVLIVATDRGVPVGFSLAYILDRAVFKMWVHTNRSNDAAVHLYESTGGKAEGGDDEVLFRYDFGK